MKKLIPSILLASAALLTGCAYNETSCPSGGCGYVSTASYVTTSGCCKTPKVHVVKSTCCATPNCCSTCNRCGSSYYGSAYDYDIGYGYGYGSYNTGWY